MRTAFDTSVLVAALSGAHEGHEVAFEYLKAAMGDGEEMIVSTHLIAELYSTLTVLQVRPRITPGQARQLVEDNVLKPSEVISLGKSDYKEALRRMSGLGLRSGAVYDALHVRAAEKAEADRLLTFNGKDFRRMPPEGKTELVVL